MKTKRVAIIGGGAAGLVNARNFLKAGAEVVIFEIGTKLGGVWVFKNDSGRSSAYRSLHINTPYEFTHFDDYPFRTKPKMFPSHTDMALYLNSFADEYDLRNRTRFKAEVTLVQPAHYTLADGEPSLRWLVKASDGFEEFFDVVIVATGHLTEPKMPDSTTPFTGELLHSHYYEEPERFRGKRVLVIGTGNSALDIAADLSVIADRTVISARSPELITPKIAFGLPLGKLESLFKKPWLPHDTSLWVRRLLTRVIHGRMETWGLQTPKGRSHPISHATLINHIAYDRVKVHPGIASIQKQTVTFTNGLVEEFDCIIAATGYDLSFPFLDKSIVRLDSGGSLNLYGRAVPPKWPGLYFAGFFNTIALSNLRIDDYQSKWLVALETGQVVLPDFPEMQLEIESVKAWIKGRYPNTPRYAFELEPTPYLKFIKQEERHSPRRIAATAKSQAFLFANRSASDRVGAARALLKNIAATS